MRIIKNTDPLELFEKEANSILIFPCGTHVTAAGMLSIRADFRDYINKFNPAVLAEMGELFNTVGWQSTILPSYRLGFLPCKGQSTDTIDFEMLSESTARMRMAIETLRERSKFGEIYLHYWFEQWDMCYSVMDGQLGELVTVVIPKQLRKDKELANLRRRQQDAKQKKLEESKARPAGEEQD